MAQSPYAMTWSSDTYGPDGPWNALSVNIGTPKQSIALYPGGNWESTVLLSTLCTNTSISSTCSAKDAGGVYDADNSLTWDNVTIQQPPNGVWRNYAMGFAQDVPIYATFQRAVDAISIGNGITVPRVSLTGISQGYQSYPGGQNYPLEVGVLSLGASQLNQTYSINDTYAVEANFLTGWMYQSGKIPSYSYGMHIGSGAHNIPGSLHLGGYDISRVLGDVSSQPYNGTDFPIKLLDIGIGVANGDSPWTSSNITNLLTPGNSSILQQNIATEVLVTGADPYLYLPQSTCDAITTYLPVTYNASLGLYFWNTKDIQYPKIVKSASYLSFTLAANASSPTETNSQNITIKVPFALLNLKLEAPLVDESTAYFPCMGTSTQMPCVLGRAFLQAAFVGVNWAAQGNWFLAQAPGPGYLRELGDSNVVSIYESNDTIIGSFALSWEETWKGHWIPLNNTDNSTFTGSMGNTGEGLSSDTIAIIGGVSGGVAFIILLLILYKCSCSGETDYSPPEDQEAAIQQRQDEESAQRPRQQPLPAAHSERVVPAKNDNSKGGPVPKSAAQKEPQKPGQKAAQSTRTQSKAQNPSTGRAERPEASRARAAARNEEQSSKSSQEEHIIEFRLRTARVISSSSPSPPSTSSPSSSSSS